MKKKHLYFIPGMAASPKIFENVSFPEDEYELHFLEWKKPLSSQETLANYSMRMCEEVVEKKPIIIGVSFGGIVAQEMSKYLKNVEKIIIISSLKNASELPKRLKIIKKLNVFKLFPAKTIENIEKYKHYFSDSISKKSMVYEKYLSFRNQQYLKWAIYNLLHWKQEENIENLVHIHGENDSVFPTRNLERYIKIEDGTHIMIITKGRKISKKIQEVLA